MQVKEIKQAIANKNYEALLEATPKQLHECEQQHPNLTDYMLLYWGELGIGFTMQWYANSLMNDIELAKERKENPDLDVPDRVFLNSIAEDFDRPLRWRKNPSLLNFV